MSRVRSTRKLILDRLQRNINCHNESMRRLEEITGMYVEGEENNPGQYAKLIAQVEQLHNAEKAMSVAYQAFFELARP